MRVAALHFPSANQSPRSDVFPQSLSDLAAQVPTSRPKGDDTLPIQCEATDEAPPRCGETQHLPLVEGGFNASRLLRRLNATGPQPTNTQVIQTSSTIATNGEIAANTSSSDEDVGANFEPIDWEGITFEINRRQPASETRQQFDKCCVFLPRTHWRRCPKGDEVRGEFGAAVNALQLQLHSNNAANDEAYINWFHVDTLLMNTTASHSINLSTAVMLENSQNNRRMRTSLDESARTGKGIMHVPASSGNISTPAYLNPLRHRPLSITRNHNTPTLEMASHAAIRRVHIAVSSLRNAFDDYVAFLGGLSVAELSQGLLARHPPDHTCRSDREGTQQISDGPSLGHTDVTQEETSSNELDDLFQGKGSSVVCHVVSGIIWGSEQAENTDSNKKASGLLSKPTRLKPIQHSYADELKRRRNKHNEAVFASRIGGAILGSADTKGAGQMCEARVTFGGTLFASVEVPLDILLNKKFLERDEASPHIAHGCTLILTSQFPEVLKMSANAHVPHLLGSCAAVTYDLYLTAPEDPSGGDSLPYTLELARAALLPIRGAQVAAYIASLIGGAKEKSDTPSVVGVSTANRVTFSLLDSPLPSAHMCIAIHLPSIGTSSHNLLLTGGQRSSVAVGINSLKNGQRSVSRAAIIMRHVADMCRDGRQAALPPRERLKTPYATNPLGGPFQSIPVRQHKDPKSRRNAPQRALSSVVQPDPSSLLVGVLLPKSRGNNTIATRIRRASELRRRSLSSEASATPPVTFLEDGVSLSSPSAGSPFVSRAISFIDAPSDGVAVMLEASPLLH